MNSPPNSCLYEFEGFVLDPLQRVLRTLPDGQMVRLSSRAFDALHVLVSHHGQLVDKDTLMKALWPKAVVEENSLTQVIRALRQSLSEKPGEHRFIFTAPGRGYQFVATVKEVPRRSADSNSGPTIIPPNGVAEHVQMPIAVAPELAVMGKTRAGGISSRSLLRWGTLIIALIVMASAWRLMEHKDTTKPASVQQPAAVAVLPFVNLTGDASKDYMGDGMAEELINTLAKVPGLKVPARTSSFSYKGRNVDARQIARELGVGTIVEGSVRSAGDEIRITAQLINAQDGLHLWSETYNEQFTDIFKLQDKLATEIATALHANLSGNGVAVVASKPPTQNVEAYRLYLQGTALLDRTTLPNVEHALDLFQQAIARDAKFAQAYEGVARGYLLLLGLQQLERPALLAAEHAARKALSLDPESSSALSSLAVISARRDRWLDLEIQSRASVKLNAVDAIEHRNRAGLLQRAGKLRAAMQEWRIAYELAPSNAYVVGYYAFALAARGLDAEARKFAQLAEDLGMSRDEASQLNLRYFELLHAKLYSEAAEIPASSMNQTDPEQARTAEIIRATYAALADPSRRAAALATYARLYPHASRTAKISVPLYSPRLVNCTGGAHGFALLGELDVAYELANHCLDIGASSGYTAATVRLWTPEMRAFRQDPRFHAYVSRFGDLMDYYKKYGPPDDCDVMSGKLICH